ncbi:MAG: GDP-fucose synthetase [Flavobacteriales bacterium]|nr:GDP-fucose synthetase [Flavobacteriales bacterium]
MNSNKKIKIYIAGHSGMVGSACMRLLEKLGYSNLIVKSSAELDLKKQSQVYSFIKETNPDVIINAAARVGGILANKNFPYEFLLDNMQIQNNLISSAHDLNTSKFIFLGSSCIYPRLSLQPIKENYLLTNSLEPTNEYYAIAKISGLKLCEAIRKQFNKDFVSLMPCNLYGPEDNFNLESSHVIPAMIQKFYHAKQNNKSSLNLWGTGKPFREFLHVDDLANAIALAVENELPESIYNVGSSVETSIKGLAEIIQSVIGYEGVVNWDYTKPDGTPRKLLDSSKIIQLGWRPKCDLKKGIKNTYSWFLENQTNLI